MSKEYSCLRNAVRFLQGRYLLLLAVAVSAPCAIAGADLNQLFDEEWQFRLKQNPLLASSVGVDTYDNLLPDVSPENLSSRANHWREFLQRLKRIDTANLSAEARINASLFRRQLENFVSEIEFGAWQSPITSESGFHMGLARLPARAKFNSPADYESYIARLNAIPKYFAQQIENMRTGLARGWTQPAIVLGDYWKTAEAFAIDDPKSSAFYAPFAQLPADWPEAQDLRTRGIAAVRDAVIPAYRQLAEFFRHDYVPGARKSLGASELPQGSAWYDTRVRYFATYNIGAEEIHKLGLAEVARIRSEMEAIIEALGFEGDFDAFLEFLRNDDQFYAHSPEELLKQAAWIAKRMDAALPSLFNHLPRLPYGVAPVPDAIAPRYTGGRYVPPPAGSAAPGYYWVNTYDLKSRPLYTLTALTLHESVPGHHLQHALALEQGEQPAFRRHSYISAYGEGWALYAERLGKPAGLYQDPYSDFGRLTYEMWRACRLVVDTGLHLKGWSRERVVDYLSSNTALSLHEINTETDRYISWPAQALSYKLGEIRIRELRDRARSALGNQFSLPAFHDAVLATGSVTLEILDAEVNRFIAQTKTRTGAH